MQFLIPLKKYNIFLSPIKTSLMEHFRGEAVEACKGPTRPPKAELALSALMFTNNEQESACKERLGFCTA